MDYDPIKSKPEYHLEVEPGVIKRGQTPEAIYRQGVHSMSNTDMNHFLQFIQKHQNIILTIFDGQGRFLSTGLTYKNSPPEDKQ